MSLTHRHRIALGVFTVAIITSLAIVQASGPQKEQEQERSVKAGEVPKAALDALQKQAGANKLTEFSEEIEHGVTYYEGSYNGPLGHVDVLVTAAGDLVEVEEAIPVASAPKAVLDKVGQAAGKDAALYVEKKTVIMYEVKYNKDGRRHEVVYSPDGREHEHESERALAENDD